MPLHCQSKEKEIQRKRNIKSRKIDKRKRKMFSPHVHHNTIYMRDQDSYFILNTNICNNKYSVLIYKRIFQDTIESVMIRG